MEKNTNNMTEGEKLLQWYKGIFYCMQYCFYFGKICDNCIKKNGRIYDDGVCYL